MYTFFFDFNFLIVYVLAVVVFVLAFFIFLLLAYLISYPTQFLIFVKANLTFFFCAVNLTFAFAGFGVFTYTQFNTVFPVIGVERLNVLPFFVNFENVLPFTGNTYQDVFAPALTYFVYDFEPYVYLTEYCVPAAILKSDTEKFPVIANSSGYETTYEPKAN